MKIAAVIVTFNRKELLEKVLNQFDNMTRKPDRLIVVNNASNDGTDKILKAWFELSPYKNTVKIINLQENLGGSGGFNKGLNEAIKLDVDWVWLSDDDAFPDLDIFEKFINFKKDHDSSNVGAYCTSVINNGEIDLKHRRILSNTLIKKEISSKKSDYSLKYFKVDLFSYVGAIINKNVLVELGVTEKDYFIWYDDTEHSMRISKKYDIYCIPNLKVIHNEVPTPQNTLNWKSFYGKRNKLLMYKKHYPITFANLLLKMTFSLFLDCIKSVINPKKRKLKNLPARNKLKYYAIKSSLLEEKGLNIRYMPGKKIT